MLQFFRAGYSHTVLNENKVQNRTNDKKSIIGGNLKVSGYFREEDETKKIIHHLLIHSQRRSVNLKYKFYHSNDVDL